MIVYRVEMPVEDAEILNRVGFYSYHMSHKEGVETGFSEFQRQFYNTHRHPEPKNDINQLIATSGYHYVRFGFASLEQYSNWFHAERDKLRFYGFVLGVYKIRKNYVVIEETQCAFLKDKATWLKDMNTDEV